MTHNEALNSAQVFLDLYHPGVATDHRFHVIHRVVGDIDVTVVQLSAFKAEGPDGGLARRFVYGLLGTWHVDHAERPEGHVHGLCWACTKAYRRAHGITSNNDLARIPFYGTKARVDAIWAQTEAELDTLPKTRMTGG